MPESAESFSFSWIMTIRFLRKVFFETFLGQRFQGLISLLSPCEWNLSAAAIQLTNTGTRVPRTRSFTCATCELCHCVFSAEELESTRLNDVSSASAGYIGLANERHHLIRVGEQLNSSNVRSRFCGFRC